jgi:hypothetical protein
MQRVKAAGDLPPLGKYFLIQIYKDKTIYHEGDERSKSCPGHGYPAYTEHYLDVQQYVTTNREEWLKGIEIVEEMKEKEEQVRYLEVTHPSVTKKIVVGVN